MKRIIMLLLALALALSAAGCSEGAGGAKRGEERRGGEDGTSSGGTLDLMADVTAREVPDGGDTDGTELADFALTLFKESFTAADGNVLLSPLSVAAALGMTANGAAGNTLSQMESALGMSSEELNSLIHGIMSASPDGRLRLANSIWLRSSPELSIKPDFLQTNADYYSADIRETSFDSAALDDINGWVSEKTDGMIEHILNDIEPDAAAYIINALAFDAKWADDYEDTQVRDGIFTAEDGTEQDAELMYSSEELYIEDELACGFIKPYEGGFAFAALLPNEGVTVAEYLKSLDAEALLDMLQDPETVEVHAAIPKFSYEYGTELGIILKSMGMTDAFDPDEADFSRMGSGADGNLFISRVVHKTFIEVAEQGTRAGAATVVEMKPTAAPPPADFKTVFLDRPFVYLIIDTDTCTPIFIGALTSVL